MADQVILANCGFFDSVNGDRLYSADQMNRPYRRLVSNGVFATQSGTPSTDLQVVSAFSGMKIIIKAGQGIFADKWFEHSSDSQITVPNNSNVVPRRDSVIVQIDKRVNGRVGNIIYRTGVASSNPQVPDISKTESLMEYRIANVYVAAGASSINNDAIVDLRGSSECPWVTSLVQQVDTSVLFNQWQTAYENYYTNSTQSFTQWSNQKRQAFEDFLEELTSELTVTSSTVAFDSTYTTTAAETALIPIGISTFDKEKDILSVYINHQRVAPGIDYEIAEDSSSITLTSPLTADQTVSFRVLKSVVNGDVSSAMSEIEGLTERVDAIDGDSGWITFTLESGATAYDANSAPAVRKFGKQVFIRGAIKGLNTLNSAICTLPTAYIPAKPHYYSAVVGGVVCTLKVASTVTIVAKSGNIGATDMLPIATSFILG